jgi:hypothetical protein
METAARPERLVVKRLFHQCVIRPESLLLRVNFCDLRSHGVLQQPRVNIGMHEDLGEVGH